VHWDGKLVSPKSEYKTKKEIIRLCIYLNYSDANEKPVERLPILVIGNWVEKLLGAPEVLNSTCKEQAKAIYDALHDWDLQDNIQAICCDTTPSNTGRLRWACAILEQQLGRDLLYFPCRHHIYELVWRGVVEAKLPKASTNADLPLFKNFKKLWPNLNRKSFEYGAHLSRWWKHIEPKKTSLLHFPEHQLELGQKRNDYKEFLELSILFINEMSEKRVLSIKAPGGQSNLCH